MKIKRVNSQHYFYNSWYIVFTWLLYHCIMHLYFAVSHLFWTHCTYQFFYHFLLNTVLLFLTLQHDSATTWNDSLQWITSALFYKDSTRIQQQKSWQLVRLYKLTSNATENQQHHHKSPHIGANFVSHPLKTPKLPCCERRQHKLN